MDIFTYINFCNLLSNFFSVCNFTLKVFNDKKNLVAKYVIQLSVSTRGMLMTDVCVSDFWSENKVLPGLSGQCLQYCFIVLACIHYCLKRAGVSELCLKVLRLFLNSSFYSPNKILKWLLSIKQINMAF